MGRPLLIVAAVLAVALAGCATPVRPIETGVIEQTTPDGPVRGIWARIRVDHPAVEIVVTGRRPPAETNPAGTEARLLTVEDWAEAERLVLAVNANFFGGTEVLAAGARDPGWYPDRPVDLRGLSLTDGVVVSPPRSVGGRGDPAVVVTRDGRARAGYLGPEDLRGAFDGVAGIGPSDNGREPGDLLVTAGRNTGATARVAPKVRHPRTAAGVMADGRTLILLVVDGRQPEHSIGVTLPELADLMIGLGADAAVNLDGGGSSTFWHRRPDGSVETNQPSGGRWRPVGNHLGVRLKKR